MAVSASVATGEPASEGPSQAFDTHDDLWTEIAMGWWETGDILTGR
ncbi:MULTISPECIES: hypothetical protein [unclassified Nocardia]|nr:MULTISPECIES: hypothetical protein [unclassified Nocardia]